MKPLGLWVLIVTALGCSPSDLTTGVYVDPVSERSEPDGSDCSPYQTMSQAIDGVGRGGGVITVVSEPLQIGGVVVDTQIRIEGNKQLLVLSSQMNIGTQGSLLVKNAKISSVIGGNIAIRGRLRMESVDLASIRDGFASVFGSFELVNCTVQSSSGAFASMLAFGSSVRFEHSGLRNFDTAVVFRPSDSSVSPDVLSSVVIVNCTFEGFNNGVRIDVDRTEFSGTYVGVSSLIVEDTHFLDFQERAISGSLLFWSLSVQTSSFTRGRDALSVSLSEQPHTIAACQFSYLTNGIAVIYLACSLSISECVFSHTIQSIIIAQGSDSSVLSVTFSQFENVGDSASIGSALFATHIGRVQFVSSHVSSSRAKAGASISAYSVLMVEVTGSTFCNMTAAHAAAIDLKDSNLAIIDSSYDGVKSGENVFSVRGQSTTVINSLVGNDMHAGSSMFYCLESDTTIVNSVISNSQSEVDFLKLEVSSAPIVCSHTEFHHISFKTAFFTSYAAQIYHFFNVTFEIGRGSDTLFANYGTLVNVTNSTITGSVGSVFGGVGPTGKTVVTACLLIHLTVTSIFAAGNAIMEVYNTTFAYISILSAKERPLSTTPILLSNVSVSDLTGEFLNSKQSVITIETLTVRNCVVLEDFSFIDAVQSSLTVSNADFSDISIAKSASLFAIDLQSALWLSSSSFHRVNSSDSSGLISLQQSVLGVDRVVASGFNTSFVCASESTLTIANSHFSDTGAMLGDFDGGVVSGLQMLRVSLTNSTFTRMAARTGGAVFVTYTNPNKASLQRQLPATGFVSIAECQFEGCFSRRDGAAVYLAECTATMSDLSFRDNVAGRNGGALALYCNPSELQYQCRYSVSNTSFVRNSAVSDGGAIKYDKVEPVLENVTGYGNTAIYGAYMAAYPVQLRYITDSYSGYLINSESGRTITDVIIIGLYDTIGQLIVSDSTSVCSLKAVNKSTLVSGLKTVRAKGGLYRFAGLSVTDRPGATVALQFSSEAIDYAHADPNSNRFNQPVELDFALRQCVIGEIIENSVCDMCVAGTYSFHPSDTVCSNCPSGLTCLGGANTTVKADYWRPLNTSELLLQCHTKDICLGGSDSQCETGYFGRLCTMCAPGYFRFGNFFCLECGNPVFGMLRGVLVLLGTLVFIVVIILGNLRSTAKKKSAMSTHLRIFINYNQVSMLMSSLQVKWPSDLLSFFEGLKMTGNAAQFAFSSECLLSESSVNYIYQKTAVVAGMPMVGIGVAVGVWGIVSAVKRSKEYLRIHFVCSVVVLLLTTQPIVLQSSLQMFPCQEVEPGSLWLLHDLRIACWEGDHLVFSLGVALPAILIWSIFTPFLMWGLVFRLRGRLNDVVNLRRIGFLYSGYRPRVYYWEFIVVLRKSLMVVIANLLVSVTSEIQSEVAIGVLWLFLITHYQAYPFESKRYNRTEFFSLFASVATVIAGALYLSDLRSHIGAYYSLLVVAFMVNCFFILYWLLLFCVYLSQNIAKFACLASLFEKCCAKYI